MTHLHVRQFAAEHDATSFESETRDMVFLHGLFGSGDNFGAVARLLQTRYRVSCIDLPGHGLSPTLPRLSLDAMADAIGATLINRGIEQAVLVGHSLGGKVAMALAATPASKLSGLIVADIAPRQYAPSHTHILDALLNLPLATLKDRREADALLSTQILEPGVRAFLLKNLCRADDGFYSWRFDLAGLHRDYDLLREPPAVSPPISCPVAFIRGTLSDYIADSDIPLLQSVANSVSVHEIAGAGHWLHAEKPREFAAQVEHFMATLQPHEKASEP